MAKAADCKSAIPGSNPGGASFLSYYHRAKLALVVLLCASYAENFVRPLPSTYRVRTDDFPVVCKSPPLRLVLLTRREFPRMLTTTTHKAAQLTWSEERPEGAELYQHRSGYWAKKYKGKTHYLGPHKYGTYEAAMLQRNRDFSR